jgi:hypothetical protein
MLLRASDVLVLRVAACSAKALSKYTDMLDSVSNMTVAGCCMLLNLPALHLCCVLLPAVPRR